VREGGWGGRDSEEGPTLVKQLVKRGTAARDADGTLFSSTRALSGRGRARGGGGGARRRGEAREIGLANLAAALFSSCGGPGGQRSGAGRR
jgi:hypothetical protein